MLQIATQLVRTAATSTFRDLADGYSRLAINTYSAIGKYNIVRVPSRAINLAPEPAVRSSETEREPVQVTSDAERPMSNARRNVTGSTEGE